MTIGQRIKKRRNELGLSVDEVAKKLGKNRATVYRYEKDDIKDLPITVLEPLASVLETTQADLMGWEESKSDIAIVSPDNKILCIVEYMSPQKKDRALRLMQYYSMLNEIGQKKALDNLEDLAKIYSEKKTIQPPSTASDEPAPYGSSDNIKNNVFLMHESVATSDNAHLIPDAAHNRTDISEDERTDELIRQEDDIMDNPDF